MSSNKNPRRLPVYIDRVNNRLLANPQDGSSWFVITPIGGGSSPPASLTAAGIVQLEDAVDSTSTSKAATPNAVRQAFQLAETANMAATGAATNATTALNNSQVALTTANSISSTANQANANAVTAIATANAAATTANNAATAVSGKLDTTGGTLTGDVIISHSGRLGFEGSTNDVFETYLAVVDPTSDRTITFPNASGNVPLLETSNTWLDSQVFTAPITFTNATCTGQLFFRPGGNIAFEGSTDDAFETFIYAIDPTADRSIFLPNASGTIALLENLSAVATSGSYLDLLNRPTLGSAASLDVAASGDASASQVVKGNDSRLATNLSYAPTTRVLSSSTGNGATLPLVANAAAGLAPASGGGTNNFLRADGTWAVPPGSLGTDGDRGDITVSGGGTTWTIDNGAVTYSKMQTVSVGNRLLGKAGSLPGPIEEIPCSQAGRDLIGASDVGEQRVRLGLGSLAQLDALGFISSTGAIGTLAGQPLITTTGGQLSLGSFGTSAGTYCQGNDSRLSNSRTTPNLLTFASNGTGVAPGTTFDGSAARTVSFNTVGAASETHAHGNISNGGAIGTAANLPIITGLNGVLTVGSFGTTTGTFCQGNDSRLGDARLTPNALTFTNAGGGAASGSTFNGSAARTISYDSIGAAASSHSHGQITNAGAIGTTSGLPIITGASGVLQAGSFGATAGTFCQGNDSRLADTRNTTNALTFSSSGGGAASGSSFNGSTARTISYDSIGAAPTANPVFTGNMQVGDYILTGAGLASGSPSFIEIGSLRSGSAASYLDFVVNAGNDFDARIFRNDTANGALQFINAGTGAIQFILNGTTAVGLQDARMSLGAGGGIISTSNAAWDGRLTGGTSTIYHNCYALVSSDSTASAAAYVSQMTTANAASSTTFSVLRHFDARGTGGKGTNTTITAQYGFEARNALSAATSNYGFYSNVPAGATNYNFYAASTADNYFGGKVTSAYAAANTLTGQSANVAIDANGTLFKAGASSRRYKTDIVDLDISAADNVVLNARPVRYRSLSPHERPDWSFYGLIAEELAELDPRLVVWERPTKEVVLRPATPEVLDDEGNVLQQAEDAILGRAPDEDAELRPDGISYDRLTVLLISTVQRQQQEIEQLKGALSALTAASEESKARLEKLEAAISGKG